LKAVIQRVKSASVSVDDKIIGEIAVGFLILLGVEQNDTEDDLNYLVKKTVGLRIFKDVNKNMNLSIQDVGGKALVVSQFTLCADTSRGRRPSFIKAANPEEAESMYQQFCEQLNVNDIPIERGRFGAMMDVSLVNDGPVTIILDSREKN
jgi:D-tyrosyl-tRNA(Tyr) deacylase|tara:strand:- start:344 stop:793 length:450 start_codon:yes stop_codon:yes gene_type:complete